MAVKLKILLESGGLIAKAAKPDHRTFYKKSGNSAVEVVKSGMRIILDNKRQ